MILMCIGLTIFFTTHTIPWTPALREKMISGLGLNGYRILFATASAIGLVITVYGYGFPKGPMLWVPPDFAPRVATFLVPLAFILVASAYIGSNIKRITAHPMLWGVALWAFAHLVNNTDISSVILFGSFLIYAFVAMANANKRGASPLEEEQPRGKDVAAIGIGLAAAFIVMMLHQTLFGVPVIPT